MALTGNYHFLTTKPLTRYLYESQQEWLYVLALADLAAAVLDVVITYTDDSTQDADIDLGDIDIGGIVVVNLGFDAQDYKSHNPAKTIRKIVVKIDSDDEAITYYPKVANSDNVRYLFYMNSLGGKDSLVCTGDYQDKIDLSRLISQRQLSDNPPMDEAEFVVSNQKAREYISFFSGWKPEKEVNATKDMFLTNQIYEQISQSGTLGYVPLIVDQQSVTYPSKNDNKKAVGFEARHAWDEVAMDRVV